MSPIARGKINKMFAKCTDTDHDITYVLTYYVMIDLYFLYKFYAFCNLIYILANRAC